MTSPRSCIVVGAGFSGLSLAYWAAKSGARVRLLEEKQIVGGLLSSHRTKGNLVETAANAFLWSSDFAELEKDLGIRFIGTRPESRRRFIYRASKFRRWPLGILETLGLVFKLLCNPRGWKPRSLETISAWGQRVLGRTAGRVLLETALQGIYAGDPSRMSASLILSRFFTPKTPQKAPSRRRGSYTHPEGMGALAQAMRRYLETHPGVEIKVGHSFGPDELSELRRAGNHVFLAVPPLASSVILEKDFPALAASLKSIEMRSVATATTVWKRPEGEKKMPQGFGALFPRGEDVEALGVLRNDLIFEKRSEQVSETWIYSGEGLKALGSWGDENALRQLIVAERAAISGRDLAPELFECYFWEKGIPHYTVALETTLKECDLENFGKRENVDVFGNFTGTLGLSRIFTAAKTLIRERLIDV
ncbi:MAG: FAD-dependent oxidoreductase [Bdellovibrionota bacterium]